MGVPKFYSWLRNKNRISHGILQSDVPSSVGAFLLDLNGILHEVAQLTYGYGKHANVQRQKLVTQTSQMPGGREELQGQYMNALSIKLRTLLAQVNPLNLLVLAVDGVAPMAKINQQRMRRFRTGSSTVLSSVFDPNSLSPGTDFMFAIDAYLKQWIADNYLGLPKTVMYSSHMVPGEGEQKIFAILRQINPGGVSIVYGLDADLIILSLLSPYRILLMREDLNDLVSIDEFALYLSEYLGTATAVDDFAFMTFLIGNDFLPNLPAFEDLPEALDLLMKEYKALGLSILDKTPPDKTNGVLSVNFPNLMSLLKRLATSESSLLNHQLDSRNPSPLIKASIVSRNQISGGKITPVRSFSISQFSNLWYEHSLGPRGNTDLATRLLGYAPFQVTPERINQMSTQYLLGLNWMLNYYQGNNVNLAWFYPYHFSPLLADLIRIPSVDVSKIFSSSQLDTYQYLNAAQQLLAILPLSSASLLPVSFQTEALFGNLADLYPVTAIEESKSSAIEWHSIVFLPFVIASRLIADTPGLSQDQINHFSPESTTRLDRIFKNTNQEQEQPTPFRDRQVKPAISSVPQVRPKKVAWKKKKPLV